MQSDGAKLGFAGLVREAFELLISNWWRVLVAAILLVPLGVVIDLGLIDEAAGLLFTLLAFLFQIWISEATLRHRTGRLQSGFGSGAAFRVVIVSQLAILVGLLLLVVPGIIAFVRWSMVVPVALSSRTNVYDSMKESWHRTKGHFWTALGLFVVAYLPLVAAVVLVTLTLEKGSFVFVDVAANILIVLGLVAGWHAALSLFFSTYESGISTAGG